MAETDKSFWGHLDDLRKVLFKMAGVLAVFMAGFFYFMPWLFDNVIMAPCHGDFALYRLFADITGSIPGLEAFSTSDFNVEIINYNLTAQFFTHINLSLWLAVVFAFPVLLYLLWTFVRPALYEGGARSPHRVHSWHVDVLSWCCSRLFPRVPHHDALPLHISVEHHDSQSAVARLLYGQFLDAQPCHGTCF